LGVGAYALINVKKAIPELIETVNLCKDKLTAEVKEHLFGIKGTTTTIATAGLISDTVQSSSTEAMVAATKSK
jgi:hypothetical protein